MIIQGTGNVASMYGAVAASPSPTLRRTDAGNPSITASSDEVRISEAGRAIQDRVREIESKPAVQRTPEENEYISKHDARLNEIQAKVREKSHEALTSSEVDYMQKAGGFVNTMSYLSPGEKALYDEMVAKGDSRAAQGLLLIGMSRIGMEGQTITLPNGKTFDPTDTEVTAYSVRNLYKYLFVDPSGETDGKFEALASWLENRSVAAGSAATA